MTELNIGAELVQARDEMEAACARIADVQRAVRDMPLPDPTLTEDAIVAALKADPAMAGRVVARYGMHSGDYERSEFAAAAASRLNEAGAASICAVKMLAVALAAASYRG